MMIERLLNAYFSLKKWAIQRLFGRKSLTRVYCQQIANLFIFTEHVYLTEHSMRVYKLNLFSYEILSIL